MGLKDIFAAHAEEAPAKKNTINVEGMHCNACEKLVCTALEDRGAHNATADHETGVVEFEGDLAPEAVSAAITEAGFRLA